MSEYHLLLNKLDLCIMMRVPADSQFPQRVCGIRTAAPSEHADLIAQLLREMELGVHVTASGFPLEDVSLNNWTEAESNELVGDDEAIIEELAALRLGRTGEQKKGAS